MKMLSIKGINIVAFAVSVTASKRKLCEPVSPACELARHPMSGNAYCISLLSVLETPYSLHYSLFV